MAKIHDVDGIPTLRIEAQEDVKDYHLVDVRRSDEFTGELGHIAGAVLKTLGPELGAYLPTLDKTKPVLFICRSGARSATAAMMAMDVGLDKVFNMEGGMIYWNQLGFDVVRN
jgi:rhodanese-related sulfurtransferase